MGNRCRTTFDRDQVLAGDCITWVDGISEPENMNAYLLHLKQQADGRRGLPLKLRMRVLRASTLKTMLVTGSSSLAQYLSLRNQTEKQGEDGHAEVPQPHTGDDDPWVSGADPWAPKQAPILSQESMAFVDYGVLQASGPYGDSRAATSGQMNADAVPWVGQPQVHSMRLTHQSMSASLWQ